jgi:hypothetical protein
LQLLKGASLANAVVAVQNWNKNPIGILVGNRKPGQFKPIFCENSIVVRADKGGPWFRGNSWAAGNDQRMQDALNLVMLICAAVAALAFGVLGAYIICRGAFAALKMHARAFAEAPQSKPEIARVI